MYILVDIDKNISSSTSVHDMKFYWIKNRWGTSSTWQKATVEKPTANIKGQRQCFLPKIKKKILTTPIHHYIEGPSKCNK